VTDVETPPNADDTTGKTLTIGGRYQVRRALGAGGMGVVYEALHTWTGRRVAVKVLSSERVREKGFDERFAREARAAARVHHRNVVDVLDSGFDPDAGGFYIVQELLEGEDLRARLTRVGPLAPDEAVTLMVAVTEGLSAVHEHQIVHRDVKPGNIFLARSPDGGETPKVIDFGVSKLLDEPTSADTTTGQVLGTPRYMAPEQLRGERDLDARADVWAAGAVLYECLSGRAPFDAANHNLLVFEVLSGASVAAIEGVPSSLMAVVRRALERDRTRRFASMSELRDALIAWRYEAPVRPSRRVSRTALSLLAVALVATAGFVAMRTRHAPTTTPRDAPVAAAPSTAREVRPEVAPPSIVREAPTAPATTVASAIVHRPAPSRPVRHHVVAAPAPVERVTPPQAPSPAPVGEVAPSSRARLLEPIGAYPNGAR
jgi:eukaryotic-like serine/threonine-protein kinase